jgi:hypothetical protein
MSLRNYLNGIKVLISYLDNVSKMVNMKTLNLHFNKLYDCYILIEQFLPIVIRGILSVKH